MAYRNDRTDNCAYPIFRNLRSSLDANLRKEIMKKGTKLFKMLMEPHTPLNPKYACNECVLDSGPMCLDRSYCEFRKTGKTWKKSLKEIK